MKSIKLRKLTYSKPEIIIRNGRIDRDSMLRNRFTVDELMQELRAQGQNDASKIAYGVLETNGQLSLILTGPEQPATASMLGAVPAETGYAHIIINDGRILDKISRCSAGTDGGSKTSLNAESSKAPTRFTSSPCPKRETFSANARRTDMKKSLLPPFCSRLYSQALC